jgi:hypothetical protein
MSGIVKRRLENRWISWLNRVFYTLDTDEPVKTHIWVTNLIEEDLANEFYKKGYMLNIHWPELTNKIMNNIYDFEESYLKGEKSPIYENNTYRMEDFDYFLNIKCPDAFWEKLRKNNTIEWFADGDDFSTRLWIEIPFWVAQYIDFRNSSATDELNEMLSGSAMEDDSSSDTEKKKEVIDPYVQDYY